MGNCKVLLLQIVDQAVMQLVPEMLLLQILLDQAVMNARPEVDSGRLDYIK